MSGTHTPGEWKAYDNYVDIPGKPFIEVNTGNPIEGDSSNDTHLIAAAPEMYAALKALEFTPCAACGVLEQISAAIAKAEGREQ